MGMSMLQPGGSLVEISAGAAGGLITVTIVNRYLLPHLQNKHLATAGAISSLAAPRLKT
jgi:hypothetical protein